MLFASRRRAVVAMLVAGIAIASGAPSWGSNTESLHNHKHSKSSIRRPGGNDFADGEFNFNSVSPKDCANYLCVSSASLASDYIESGCPGQFVMYESADSEADLMGSFAGISTESSSGGVSTGTLLSLAGACGVFAAGVGFFAGYKSSPSFAYMRIPSLA